jgi:hypothetical protein
MNAGRFKRSVWSVLCPELGICRPWVASTKNDESREVSVERLERILPGVGYPVHMEPRIYQQCI